MKHTHKNKQKSTEMNCLENWFIKDNVHKVSIPKSCPPYKIYSSLGNIV